jgi:tetratricopeptide (TPR) repeat protein
MKGGGGHTSMAGFTTRLILPLVATLALAVAGCAGRSVQEEPKERVPAAVPVAAAPESGEGKKTQAAGPGAGSEASAEYHFSLAQAYVAEGNPDRAIEEFKLTLMFDPSSALVHTRLATEYIKKGMLTAAMETCKEALQRDPTYTDARLILAGLYSTTHENAAALEEYSKILKADPKHEEAAVYRSQVLAETGKMEEATRTLRQFVKRNSDSALAWYYLGRAEEAQDHVREAVRAYRQAMDARPGFSQAAMALGFLYEQKNQVKEALQVYQELYDQTQDTGAANRIATLHLKAEKYDQAVPFLEAVSAADPEDLNARVKLGLVQMELKRYEKAIAIFKEILAKQPDSDRIHYYLGSLYEETKRADDAIAELKLIKPDSKLYGDAALHVAYLMKQGGSAEGARRYIDDAIEKSPRNPSFYIFRASLDEDAKNVAGAVDVLKGAVARFPEDEKLRYYLGSLYDRMGQTDRGLEQMEAILTVNPQNVDALNYIGYTWTTQGVRLSDAEKMLRQAMKLRPNNGFIQDSWGWYLLVRGRVSEAVVELEKAAKLKPNESVILEHLADAYTRANLRQKAQQRYRDAARFAEDDAARKKIEDKLQTLRTEMAREEPAGTATRSPASTELQSPGR